jgi:hypothetical protein
MRLGHTPFDHRVSLFDMLTDDEERGKSYGTDTSSRSSSFGAG